MVEFVSPSKSGEGLVFDPPRIRFNCGQQGFTFRVTSNLENSCLFKWTILQHRGSVGFREPPLDGYGVVESKKYKTVDVLWEVDEPIPDYQQGALCVEGVEFQGQTIYAYERSFQAAVRSGIKIYSWLLYFLHLPLESNGLGDVVNPEPEADSRIVNWVGKAPPKTDQWYPFQTTNNKKNAYGFWKIPRVNIPEKLGSYLKEQCSDEARAFIMALSLNHPDDLSIPKLAVEGEYEAVIKCIERHQKEKDSIKLESTSRNGVWVCKIRFPGNAASTDMVVKQVRGMSPFESAFGESARLLSTRALKELLNTSQTLHENVVRLVGFTMQGVMVYVLPYYEEGSVTGYIQRCIDEDSSNPLMFAPLALRIQLIKEIALGLVYIHELLCFIHGDLKYNNVLVKRIHGEMFGVRAIIIDFGFSMSVHSDNQSDEEKEANILGVPRYWAPELFVGEPKEMLKTFGTDVYAYACLAGEIGCGPEIFQLAERRRPQGPAEAGIWYIPVTRGIRKPVPRDLEPSTHIPATSEFWNFMAGSLADDPTTRFTIAQCLNSVKMVEQESKWRPSGGLGDSGFR